MNRYLNTQLTIGHANPNKQWVMLDITYLGIQVRTRMRTRNSFGANGRAHRLRIVCARSTGLAGVIVSRVEAQ